MILKDLTIWVLCYDALIITNYLQFNSQMPFTNGVFVTIKTVSQRRCWKLFLTQGNPSGGDVHTHCGHMPRVANLAQPHWEGCKNKLARSGNRSGEARLPVEECLGSWAPSKEQRRKMASFFLADLALCAQAVSYQDLTPHLLGLNCASTHLKNNNKEHWSRAKKAETKP